MPVKLDDSSTPSNAGTSEANGDEELSPEILRGRSLLVCKKSVRKLWAVVSFASAGS
jgi:hypothetical protein